MQVAQDFEEVSLNAPANADLDQVTEAVLKGIAWSDWNANSVTPGHIVAEIRVRNKHVAAVDVMYDTQYFSIRYKDSQNLNYNGRSIHRSYNVWVANLRRAILQFTGQIKDSSGQDA